MDILETEPMMMEVEEEELVPEDAAAAGVESEGVPEDAFFTEEPTGTAASNPPWNVSRRRRRRMPFRWIPAMSLPLSPMSPLPSLLV